MLDPPDSKSSKYIIIQIVSIGSSTLSLIFSILFIILLIYHKNYKILLFRMIINVFISDIIVSIANLLIPFLLNDYMENICISQAFLYNFGSLSSIAWSTVIFFSLYKTVVQLEKVENLEKIYWGISYGIPLILSIMY